MEHEMDDQLPEYIAKIVESEIAKQIYHQGLSGSVTEVGKLGTDIVKAIRLFTFPIQVLAKMQDKVERVLLAASKKVPEERKQEAPPQLVGPIIDKIRYLPEDDELMQMFEELLARSIDKDRIQEAHPSFIHIISQLSRDEAYILYELKQKDFEVVDVMDLNRSKNLFENRRIEKSNIPTDKLYYPENIELYYSHLDSLSLVEWPVYKQDPISVNGTQYGIRRNSKMCLTQFGKLFTKACLPEKGFV
jgi:Abortive infection alpha